MSPEDMKYFASHFADEMRLSDADQRKRDRFEAALSFATALTPLLSRVTKEETSVGFDIPESMMKIAWNMADKFLDAEIDTKEGAQNGMV